MAVSRPLDGLNLIKASPAPPLIRLHGGGGGDGGSMICAAPVRVISNNNKAPVLRVMLPASIRTSALLTMALMF